MVRSVVDSERVLFAVQRELASGNSIGEATGYRTEVRVPIFVGLEGIETQHDVRDTSLTIGNEKRSNNPTPGDDRCAHSVAAREGVFLNR
jgi:hypothetical protein